MCLALTNGNKWRYYRLCCIQKRQQKWIHERIQRCRQTEQYKALRVLSLFDGISCGRLALERAGLSAEKYDAFEIDK